MQPYGLQQVRPPCPSPTPRAYSNSYPLSRRCHPTISSSVIPFSCLHSFAALGSFPVSPFFASGGQSIGASASASILPMNIQDPRRGSRGERSPLLPLEAKPDSPVESGVRPRDLESLLSEPFPSLGITVHLASLGCPPALC